MLAIGTDLLIVESAAEEAIIEGILTRLHGNIDNSLYKCLLLHKYRCQKLSTSIYFDKLIKSGFAV